MFIVGLTGGIGSGKSTVAEAFSTLGVPVIDADIIGRELVKPGAPGLTRVVEAFGNEILDRDGALNRAILRKLVFSDAKLRGQLETLLHPLIRAEMHARIMQLDSPYCILCIPLLLETGQTHGVNRILVVDTPHYLQYRRVMARDKLIAPEVAAILRVQIPYRERLAKADDIIVNDRNRADMLRAVDELHARYQKLAKTGLPTPAK